MLSIRLKRFGKKGSPTYRVVVMERAKNPKSEYIESLGFYNPMTKPKTLKLNNERVGYWLSVGAKPSATTHNLLVGAGIIKKPKTKITIKQKNKTDKTDT